MVKLNGFLLIASFLLLTCAVAQPLNFDEPKSIDSLNAQMLQLEKQGQYQEAYQLAKKIIKLNKGSISKHNELTRKLDRLKYSNNVMSDQLMQSVKSRKPHLKSDYKKSAIWVFFILNMIGLSAMAYLLIRRRKGLKHKKKRPKQTVKNKEDRIKLTKREQDVLTQMSLLKSNPEIADNLFISKNTTKTHVSNILSKLNVSNRQQAIQKAKELKLIPSDNQGSKKSINLSIFILLFILSSSTGFTQTTLKNNSDCSFLVKVNLVEEGTCALTGEGPLVLLPANESVDLPSPPQHSVFVAYGVQDVLDDKNPPFIVGSTTCNYLAVKKSFGTCRVTLTFDSSGLLITN